MPVDRKQTRKRKIVTMDEYNKIMDKIIKKDKPVDETLIDLLEEAAKYNIKKARVNNNE